MRLSKRFFLKKCFIYGMLWSLSVSVCKMLFHNSNMKFISEKFYLMGTYGKIQIFVVNAEYGKIFIQKAINRIRYIELFLTKFSYESDIGLINSFSNSYNSVSDDTLYVLNSGIELSEKTFGYFDMGLGNVLSEYGIDKEVPVVGNVTKLKDLHGDLLYLRGNKVKLKRRNVMLDLGGIGKGYALDEAMEVFLKAGIEHVAIEFGGDVKVNAGMPSGLPWKIILGNDYYNNFVDLYTGSLAVSGGYFKKTIFSDRHHIIDPKSLKSKNNYYAVIVSGKKALICDVLSTACYSMNNLFLNKIRELYSDYEIKVYV